MGHARGWRTKLAERLEVTPEHLSRLGARARTPSVHLLERAAEAFDFDPSYFYQNPTRQSYRAFPRGDARRTPDDALADLPEQSERAGRVLQAIASGAIRGADAEGRAAVHDAITALSWLVQLGARSRVDA